MRLASLVQLDNQVEIESNRSIHWQNIMMKNALAKEASEIQKK